MSPVVTEVTFRLRAPRADALSLAPTNEELVDFFVRKYSQAEGFGSSPLLRLRHGFIAANDYYEAIVSKLVEPETVWLDVGCGRDVFPSNYRGAKVLADRCARLVGIDPDDNIHQNELLSERFQGVVEDYRGDHRFSLVTLRMVAEHVRSPERSVGKLAELTDRGGLVVIFTPWKWAPMSVLAATVPFAFHNRLKRLIWDAEPQDTFPTVYKMNTRADLKTLFERSGFQEVYFSELDDCSIFTRYEYLNALEIGFRNLLHRTNTMYPEHCLLAIFRRS